MKKTLLIFAGVALIVILLVVRLFTRQSNALDEERAWFVESLEYEFSARVDSIRMLNANTGRLWCLLETGDPKVGREDSLKRHFREHDILYLIIRRTSDTVTFLVPYAHKILPGDRVRVSSKADSIRFFREGELVASDALTSTLTGFARPFFLKNKE